MSQIIIASLPILLALLTAIWCYQGLEPRWLRLFSLFLFLTFVIQLSGFYYSKLTHGKSNHFIFNIYTIVEYGFYLFVYYQALTQILFRKLVSSFALIFALIVVYEFVLNNFWLYSKLASSTGKFLALASGLLLIIEWLKADEKIDLLGLPMFWITAGIMAAVACEFSYVCFNDYIVRHHLDPGGKIYGLLTTGSCIVEYGLFTVGFLTTTRWRKPSLS